MLDLSLKILFSPTEAMIDKARNSTQNYWRDGFLALFVAMYFAGMLQALSSLLFLIFVKKDIFTNFMLPDDTSNQMLFFVVSVVGPIIILFLMQLVILVCLVMFAYLFGGMGSIEQLFFVRVLYNIPIFVAYGIATILIVIGIALDSKFNELLTAIIFEALRCSFLFLAFYICYLDYLTLKVVYNLSRRWAIIVSIGGFMLSGLAYGSLLVIAALFTILNAAPMHFM